MTKLPRNRPRCVLAILIAAAVTSTTNPAGASEPQDGWQAGLAKVIITPKTPVWLAGYGSKRAPTGKIHDLWMKALALQAPGSRPIVLVTSDFQGIPKSMSDRVFQRLEGKHQLKREQVMLTFSHNHCGPRLGDDLIDYYPVDPKQTKLIEVYTDRMVDACVDVILRAVKDLQPATLTQSQGRTTFAVNRRNNKESEVPAMRSAGKPLQGPVDHDVPVLSVRRGDQLAAVLFGYACHPTTLSFTLWCGDYPGFAQLAIESAHPGCQAMFVNTCGGDQNPLPRRTVALCRKYGQMLATAVEQALQQQQQPITPKIKTAFSYVKLPYLELVNRTQLQAFAKDGNAIRSRWAKRLLARLQNGEKFSPTYPYPIHAWRLGEQTLMIGMGAETVVDYALRFKRQYGRGTWVCGYTDDMISYIPSRRVWEEGGYEGGWRLYEYGRPALRWAGDVETRIANTVERLVKQVR